MSTRPQSQPQLADVLATHELGLTVRRPPNYESELRAIYDLMGLMTNSPLEAIDALLGLAMDLCHAGTAGLSLLEQTPSGDQIFRWTNLKGSLAKHVGRWTPREFSFCGVCLDRQEPQLFHLPARYFKYLADTVDVPIVRALVVPIYMAGQSPGTMWILSHNDAARFDSEDVRIMTGLAKYAGFALSTIRTSQTQNQNRERAEEQVSTGIQFALVMQKKQIELEELVELRTSELRKLSAQLITSQDQERRRIARDLHDITGQNLAALKLDLDRLRSESSPADIQLALTECSLRVSEISDELRSLSYVLHPPLLDECGLLTAVEWYADGINKRSGLQVKLEVVSEPRRLPAEVEIALFRVVQAALTNVHLHSGSKTATIRIAQDSDKLVLEIIDQGRGFASKSLEPSVSMQRAGVGLVGIKERLQLIGGQLEIKTGDHGTILRSVVPVSRPGGLPA